MTEAIKQRREAWCQPISEETPCGEYARYEEEYETLKVELAKLESIHGAECDWDIVFDSAHALLQNKTKDMTVLGALCVALVKREGFDGLAAGLGAYHWLVQNHGEQIHPVRLRGRAGAYSWFTQHLTRELEQIEPESAGHEVLTLCQTAFEELDDLVRAQLEDQHPRVGDIKRAFGYFVETSAPAPEPEPEPAPEPALEAVPTQEEAIAPAPDETPTPPRPRRRATGLPASIDNEEGALAAIEAAAETLKRAAGFYLEQDERNALGYHLAHVATVLGVVPDGPKEAPTTCSKLEEVKEAADDERWRHVLKYIPELLQSDEITLDIEHQVARALEEMGHLAPLTTINGHALGLYTRMNENVDASGGTVRWIESLRSSSSPEPPPLPRPTTSSSDGDSGEDRLHEVIVAASEETSRGGLEGGCRVIQEALSQVASMPHRFKLRLALASLFVREQAADLAKPILEELFRDLEQPVSSWEPGLMVELITTLLACNRQLEANAGNDHETVEELERESAEKMALLARVDPAAACREREGE